MKPNVYYNEKCSICRIEINHYKKNCDSINWVDININKNSYNDIKINKNQLLRRIHVKNNDQILVGIDAFIFIWSKIPKYKFLSKILKFTIFYYIAIVFYEILAFFLYIKNIKQFNKNYS